MSGRIKSFFYQKLFRCGHLLCRCKSFSLVTFQIDDGGQVVAISVQPFAAAEGAEGGAFVFAFLLQQVVAAEDFVMVVAQAASGLQQGA